MKKIFLIPILTLLSYTQLCAQDTTNYYGIAANLIIDAEEKRVMNKDFSGALAELNQLLALPYNDWTCPAYIQRGWCKHGLNDYKGEILDYTKSINLCGGGDGHSFAYKSRGIAYVKLQKYKEAILDLSLYASANKSEIDGEVYLYLGISKIKTGEIKSGCEYLKYADEAGYANANFYLIESCKK